MDVVWQGPAPWNSPGVDLLTFMMMFRDSSLGRKMQTLRRSCMTLLLWKVSLFIVLWALQKVGWAHRVLSNRSGSQHSKANFSSSSYGQQEKHRGTPLCRFHSCTKSKGRPVEKEDSLVKAAAGQCRHIRNREGAFQVKTAVLGTQEGRHTLPLNNCLRTWFLDMS